MMKKIFASISIVLSLIGLSCYEELPPYQDPVGVFDAQIEGEYVINMHTNSVNVYLTITNTYDETFEGRAILRGQIEIVWDKDPAIRKTVQIDSSFLYDGRYDRVTGILILDPNKSIQFLYSWNLIDDNGMDMKNLFTYYPDPYCVIRFIAEPEILRLSGKIKIFKATSEAVSPITPFQFKHVREFVSQKDCP